MKSKMNKYSLAAILVAWSCCLLTACQTASPEKYFDVAVLNTNALSGIANDGLMAEMEYPSVKLVEGTKDQTTTMKRMEIIENKVQRIEETLQDLKGLHETTETKEMLQTSIALHEYALSAYKTEYRELAKLYDDGASKDVVLAKAQSIHDKYGNHYEELYNKLIGIGKTYATAHQIKVNWGR